MSVLESSSLSESRHITAECMHICQYADNLKLNMLKVSLFGTTLNPVALPPKLYLRTFSDLMNKYLYVYFE